MARKADSDWTVRVKITPAPDAVRRYAEVLRILRDVDERLKQSMSEDVAPTSPDAPVEKPDAS